MVLIGRHEGRIPFPSHKQVNLRGIEVDVLMAPILEVLWDAGIETTYSCQEQTSGYGYIAYRARDFWLMSEVLPYLLNHLMWYCYDAIPNRPGGTQWAVKFPNLYGLDTVNYCE